MLLYTGIKQVLVLLGRGTSNIIIARGSIHSYNNSQAVELPCVQTEVCVFQLFLTCTVRRKSSGGLWTKRDFYFIFWSTLLVLNASLVVFEQRHFFFTTVYGIKQGLPVVCKRWTGLPSWPFLDKIYCRKEKQNDPPSHPTPTPSNLTPPRNPPGN